MKIELKVREEDTDEEMVLYIENATEPKEGTGPKWKKGQVRFGLGDMTGVADRAEVIKALQEIGDG